MKKVYALTTDIDTQAKKIFEIKDPGLFLSRVLGVSLTAAAILTLAYLIWGAIDWLMSEGEPEKLKSARNKIIHTLAGLALIAIVWLLWRLTIYFLGIGTVGEGPGPTIFHFPK